MHALSANLTFHIHTAESLKDYWQACSSLIARTRRRSGVSVSEIGPQDILRTAIIETTVVSRDATHAPNSLDKVIRFMEHNTDAEFTAVEKQGRD